MRRLGLTIATAALLAVPASAAADTFTSTQNENGEGILFAENPPLVPSTGSAYPSTITAPAGTVTDVNVTFEFRHDFPDDLDIALVSPDGTAVTLMSDACGDDDSFHGFTFDDAANQMLQDVQDCDGTLTVDPSNFDGVDDYPAPGPQGPTQAKMSAFTGGPSGGPWQLFGVDDTDDDGGLLGSWDLMIDFTPAPVALQQQQSVVPIASDAPAPRVCPKGKKLKKGKCVKKKRKKQPKKGT